MILMHLTKSLHPRHFYLALMLMIPKIIELGFGAKCYPYVNALHKSATKYTDCWLILQLLPCIRYVCSSPVFSFRPFLLKNSIHAK
ncbi:hypothetical protein OPV22_026129 [Ensete ventricosum]|uniref:Secreted protein n=1 Tax=Ensete ventricosum TaxID=4639 RepID=A0AAV8Q9C1_ENSVE|nr:hypothetical protein OPV22_026129 [Ensete ventricosum]